MKIKKVLLIGSGSLAAILAVAIIGLLLYGLREDAARLEYTLEIDAPPEEVMPWLTEGEKVKQWVGWLIEVRSDGEPIAVGSRATWVSDDPNSGDIHELENEITTFDPPGSLVVDVSMAEMAAGTVRYSLESTESGGTRLHYVSEWEYLHWLASLFEPLITSSAQDKLEADLERMKGLIEADEATRP